MANYLVMELKGRVDWSHIGYTHTFLDPNNIKKGTDSIKLVNSVLLQYNHRGTKEELRTILDVLKERKEDFRVSLYLTNKKTRN